MTDNTIIDKIARTITRPELGKGGVTPLPFVYATLDAQNIVLDNVKPPFCAAVPLESSTVQDERGSYHDQVTIALFFGDYMEQAEPEFCAIENERIIDECKRRALIWLSTLDNNAEIQLVTINGAAREYLRNDSVLTGYTLNVTIKEIQGYGRCNLQS